MEVLGIRMAALGVAALLGGMLEVVALVQPASAAEAWGHFTTMPDSGVTRDVAVDAEHHRLFVLRENGDQFSVYGISTVDGSLLGRASSAGSGEDIAVSPDGSRVYVATPQLSSVAVVDSGSYETTQLSATSGIQALSVVGNSLWYLSGPQDSESLWDMNLTSGAVTPGPVGGSGAGGSWANAELHAVPGQHELLIDELGNGGSAPLALIDTSLDTVIGSALAFTTHTGGFAFSSDGGEVLVGDDKAVFTLPDMGRTPVTLAPPLNGRPMQADDNWLVVLDDQEQVEVLDRSSHAVVNTLIPAAGSPFTWPPFLDDGTLIGIAGDRVYVETQPAVPGPTLTFTSTAPMARRVATLSGSLSNDMGPVAGATVSISDSLGNAVGSAVTTDDGSWRLDYTWATSGQRHLVATATGAGIAKTVETSLDLNVAGLPSSLTLTAPAQVDPGKSVTVEGHLIANDDGTDIPGVGVAYDYQCLDTDIPGPIPGGTGGVTTDSQGRFTVIYDPGYCTRVELDAWWPDDAAWAAGPAVPTSAKTTVTWHQSQLALHVANDAPLVGDEIGVSASFTIDGQPAPGRSVEITVSGPNGADHIDQTLTTNDQGSVEIQIPTTQVGGYIVRGYVGATTDTLPANASVSVSTRTITTTVTAATQPVTIPLGQTAVISGHVTRTDNSSLASIPVLITATDTPWNGGAGKTRSITVNTDAQGDYTYIDTPEIAGDTLYAVHTLADGELFPASAEADSGVLVDAAPTVSLKTDRSRYTAGEPATIKVHLAGALNRNLTLTATFGNGSRQTLFTGQAPAAGLTIHSTMRHHETLTASVPASQHQEPAQATKRINVNPTVTLAAVTPPVKAGPVPIYSQRQNPQFVAHLQPATATCLTYQLEHRLGHHWHTIKTSPCLKRSRHGVIPWAYHGPRTRGPYRVRASFAGTPLDNPASSAWTAFRFQ